MATPPLRKEPTTRVSTRAGRDPFTRTPLPVTLRPVSRVDVDILSCEVAGPVEALSVALMQANRDDDLASLEGLSRFFRGDRGGRALPEYAQPAKIDIHFEGIQRNAGSSDRGQDAAPVRVLPVGGCFNEG